MGGAERAKNDHAKPQPAKSTSALTKA